MNFKQEILGAKQEYLRFLDSMRIDQDEFCFTKGSKASEYALCFAIFGYNLLNEKSIISKNKEIWNIKLRENIQKKRKERINENVKLSTDKQYLQLLCFTLSCLKILGTLDSHTFENEIFEILPKNIGIDLKINGVFDCKGGSGNYAMFMAIILIYAQEYLNIDCQFQIKEWVNSHLIQMNQFGFWGDDKKLSHHQFQNGYHQYEILEYLNFVYDLDIINKIKELKSIVDKKGHFAPWPGGSSCHDYDAYFLLTLPKDHKHTNQKLYELIISNILFDQNSDGGFCESKNVRPRSLSNTILFLEHILYSKNQLRIERLYQFLTLQRPKHDQIYSYVSDKPRKWSDSNLWDSWFRMMTIARIVCKLETNELSNWGFIDFPGIGYFRKT